MWFLLVRWWSKPLKKNHQRKLFARLNLVNRRWFSVDKHSPLYHDPIYHSPPNQMTKLIYHLSIQRWYVNCHTWLNRHRLDLWLKLVCDVHYCHRDLNDHGHLHPMYIVHHRRLLLHCVCNLSIFFIAILFRKKNISLLYLKLQ